MRILMFTKEKIKEDNEYKNNKDLIAVRIDESVNVIGKKYFSGCPNLKIVVFPESVREIDDTAFDGSGIEYGKDTNKSRAILAYCVRGSQADVWLSKNKKKYIKIYYEN